MIPASLTCEDHVRLFLWWEKREVSFTCLRYQKLLSRMVPCLKTNSGARLFGSKLLVALSDSFGQVFSVSQILHQLLKRKGTGNIKIVPTSQFWGLLELIHVTALRTTWNGVKCSEVVELGYKGLGLGLLCPKHPSIVLWLQADWPTSKLCTDGPTHTLRGAQVRQVQSGQPAEGLVAVGAALSPRAL